MVDSGGGESKKELIKAEGERENGAEEGGGS